MWPRCLCASRVCRPARAISREPLMFTWPLKRGCYQPRSRCMFAFTLGYRFARTHTCTRAQRGSFELARAHAPLPVRGPVEGHAFVSRSQDAGVCSCASRSIRFIFFSRGCPFVCGPRFISSHSSPPHHHHHQAPPQRTAAGLLCFRHSGIVYSENTILLFTADASSLPDTPKTRRR